MNDSLMAQAIQSFNDGKLDQALQTALRIDMQDPEYLQSRALAGAAATIMGQFAFALPLFEEVADQRRNDPEAQYNAGYVLKELGRFDDAVERFERALKIEPNYVEALHNKGGALYFLGRYDEAVALYRRALEIQPDHPSVLNDLGLVLRTTGHLAEAVEAYKTAQQNWPEGPGIALGLTSALLEADRVTESLAAAEAGLAIQPRDSGIIATKAIGLRLNDQIDEADSLDDYRTLLKTYYPGPPPDYDDLQGFLTALETHIRQHPSLAFEPPMGSTKQGFQTQELLVEPKGPFQVFEMLISNAIRQYLGTLPPSATHAFLKERPDSFQVTAWASILGKDGYQQPHIHPSAWISGTYYVKIPESVQPGSEDAQGGIEFGVPLANFPARYDPEVHRVAPEEGMLLMYPSYFRHQTVPSQDTEERISISFDAIATD